MLSSSSNTGSTDLRLTEVQQPNVATTPSLVISSRAFSANSGQLEAGSTTTASSFLPSTPPFLFCSSISISMTSFSVVSLIAMVPESEWRMPILIVSSAAAACPAASVRPARTANAGREVDLQRIYSLVYPEVRGPSDLERFPCHAVGPTTLGIPGRSTVAKRASRACYLSRSQTCGGYGRRLMADRTGIIIMPAVEIGRRPGWGGGRTVRQVGNGDGNRTDPAAQAVARGARPVAGADHQR